MKILVTGGAGFIGSHLCRLLLSQGHTILVLDDLSTGSYENLDGLEDGRQLRLIVDSINNRDIVDDCVREADCVYHLASAVGVRLIIDQPVRTIESIVGGTEVVLKCCARYRRPFLLTSTSEVYGKGSKVPFCEDDDSVMGATCRRRWSYACAKAMDEFLALAHWVEAKLPVTICLCSTRSAHVRRGSTGWSCRGSSARRCAAIRSRFMATARRRAASPMCRTL